MVFKVSKCERENMKLIGGTGRYHIFLTPKKRAVMIDKNTGKVVDAWEETNRFTLANFREDFFKECKK
jgi:hypothetical protein